MAKRKGSGRGLLWAGLAAGAYAYFKKPENRQKATEAFNNAKTKVNSYMESQNLENGNGTPEDEKEYSTELRENKMASEGGVSGAQYYNDKNRDDKDEDFKLSSNDTSEEKSENTETIAPENRLNTDKL
ncbi:MAG TPA: hypothetical protein VLQ20_03525 [Planococcus sp. (in: firmicutes)]|nr:hypothetical protein [Planococcus sp. (in: firmicutes)]